MRVDPRLRVLYLLAVAIGVFVLGPGPWIAAVAGLQLVLWLAVGLPLRRLLRQLFKLAGFALFVVGSYAVFEDDPGTDRWQTFGLFGWSFELNVGGAITGAWMVVRVLAVVLASQVARAGDPRAIAAGLTKLRVPVVIAGSLDVVLSLLGGDGGRMGGGGGGGGGGGRGRRAADDTPQEGFWASLKRLARGDVDPIVRRIERQIDRAEQHAEESGIPARLVRDVSVVAGISLTMLAIKALKILPNIPFAPGHKLVLLTPLYIVAGLLTRSRFGATLTGLTMGTVAFLMGDGKYGIFEILKHVTPGLVCDALLPLLVSKDAERVPGALAWSLFGGLIAAGRFATIFVVTLAVSPPAVAYAILAPGLSVNVFFGLLSGYVSCHVVRAAVTMRQRFREPPIDPSPEAAQVLQKNGALQEESVLQKDNP